MCRRGDPSDPPTSLSGSKSPLTEPAPTRLKRPTPRLGEVEASLQLCVAGVRIALSTPYQHSAADMQAGAPDLENALAAAGVPLRGFSVKIQEEPPE